MGKSVLKKPKSPVKKIKAPESHKKLSQTAKDLAAKTAAQTTDSDNPTK